ncbi:hypothetical protein [Rhodanobacter sp. DHG33]|uniref:hypothetical protein n=1 Tax=Rhodanobacter sp. DHG33 TaxID=2775921 RepID=UPI00177FDE4F|nr:hypothetical protein [Rhodanobacter sp. DHG33]MBD8900480.1 hypothetical protein [Rhodanobacter sp. DHG33]
MSTPPPLRSSFVTVLAWIFIGMTGFATLISLLQNLMLQWLFLPTMQAHPMPPLPPDMPAPMQWIFAHMAWLFRAFLLVSSVTLIAAIGLLRRKEWARRLFIGLMGLAIAYHLLGLVWQWWFMGSMETIMHTPNMPADAEAMMHGFMRVAQVFGMLMALVFCALFGWIIHRLRSARVRDEFRPWPPSR